MKCREARQLMYLYREGEIPHEIRRQIQQHAEFCRRCSRELQQSRNSEKTVADLRNEEPTLYAQRDLTDRIMRAVESDRAGESWPRLRPTVLPFRRLQISCTLAAALIAVIFFVQNGIDVDRIAALESRLDRLPSAMTAVSGESPLATLGMNRIAEFGRLVTGPPAGDKIGLQGRLQIREAVRSFLDVLRDGPPGFSGEVQRLRAKYPELWFISPLDGLSARDRHVLARQGKALMGDLRTLLQRGKTNYEN